jgi:hypothetical protein
MKVIFFSTQTQVRQDLAESQATTFQGLMDELGQPISSKMRYYIKENKVTLEHPDASIPNHDFTLVASPRDNKANASEQLLSTRLKELKTKFNNLIDFLIGGDPGDEQPEEECPNCELIEEIQEIEQNFPRN